MSARICQGRHAEAAGYMLEALEGLAEGPTYMTGAESIVWARQILASMVARGLIEPRDEVQS